MPKGGADHVSVHDFPHLGKGKAIPYGAYDIARNRAVVNVGVTHDTAEFAAESIRRWWRLDGKRHYRGAPRLLICADSGGSNGNRTRAWKLHLQALSDETGMSITVCHYPPGTSKWNKIEHRLFSFISLNWKGKPLVNYETVVNLSGVALTGSERAGESLASRAGKNLKKSTMELGGSDAFIVLEDYDLADAVKMAVVGRIGNAGQTCIGAKRFIFVGPRLNEFLRMFRAALMRQVRRSPRQARE